MIEKLRAIHKKCTGCGCCENVCPNDAIVMKYNEQYDGSLEAQILVDKCVGCTKCETACPLLNDYVNKTGNDTIPDLYAVQADDQTRYKSSSGGAFTALASYVLAQDGYVCGVAFNDHFKPEFAIIDNISDIDRLRGSKYIQVDSGRIFPEIRKLLLDNRQVLFVGCPCQVAGLKSYIGSLGENLITVDLICSNTPPYPAFKKYINEKYDISTIKSVRFRTKTCGWVSDICEVTDLDGKIDILRSWNDSFQKAYHPLLMMRQACEQCIFAGVPRVGDFSIGDFWFIDQFDSELDDKKGTSCLYVNNDRARSIFHMISDTFKLCKKVPLDYMKYNRQPGRKAHVSRDYFYKLLQNYSFEEAVDKALNREFDIGVWGVWTEKNFGSEITYFALYKLLEKMGYNVLAVERPQTNMWPNGPNETPVLFKTNPYPPYATFFDVGSKTELKELNKKCDTFIVGSDQMWHYDLYEPFGKTALLDFVHNDKKKIAYATSFGREVWTGPEKAKDEISYYMRLFDYVSVREPSGVDICREQFNVKATCVLDPVFLCDKDEFVSLARQSDLYMRNEHYIGAYILDPTEEKMKVVSMAEKKLNKDAFIITDAGFNQVDLSPWQNRMAKEAFVEDWLSNIINADFVITDSFHGVCFSILFNKPFIAMINRGRGATRFYELLTPLKLLDRLFDGSLDHINPTFWEPIDYEPINRQLFERKNESIEWLKNAIEAKKHYVKTDIDYAMERLEEVEINAYYTVKELKIRDAWYGDRLDGLERDWAGSSQVEARLSYVEDCISKIRHPAKSVPAYLKNHLKK